ncbi:GntR family transcriptional regulator [Actinoplanes utahensis]|uniref:GntR family transcriptional regulator n=1 Tax=Actinoplanes utahensis TaxID=1869 RepID=A0A0A6UBU4_ACTUT|nr:GntR family transcriptional regulator [Actinoplanes utahensis]KHD73520.1 GntR family transcriptional regulator [Actinoplanes utahensis]GIF33833.1 GntR family transcriptional regulator [Actinoplanes utahensis]
MFDDRSPIYRQIADQVKDDVLRGVLGAGQQVMSTNQYAAHYRINPATAAKAFQQLVDEGVIYKRRGVGMFVADGARDRLRTERRERFFTEVVGPMLAEAHALGIPVADIVAHLQRHDPPGDSR